ncbi:MAG TPA: efflux RND transporter periplasmic adaptor subunit [Dehalococcoidia bacterium]|nr:efflux RND transporter periplasmic adaptor subunit [Dehalococcoidia bacterium]
MNQAPPLGNRTRLLLQGGSASFRLSPFEGVVLLAVLAAAMFGGYNAYARLTDLNAPVESPPVYFEAQRTTLTSTVSTTGTVQSSQQVTLTFGTTGKIKEFLVGLGAQVKAGQPLARIDDTDLQQAVRSAQSNLDSAQARLNAVLEGPSTTDIASAFQSLNNARGQLATAQQNYADLKAKPTATELATAQQGLLQAQNALQTANDNLLKAQNDLATAQADLAAAQATAAERLSRARDDWDAASAALSACTPSAGVSLPSMPPRPVEGVPPSTASTLVAGACTSPAAVTAYNQAATAYNTSANSYATALTNVTQKQTALLNAQTLLNSGNLQRSVQSAQLGLQVAQQKLIDTQAGAKPSELDAALRAIDTAQAALDAAQARYDDLFKPPKPETVLPLQASVDQAKTQLESARQNLAAATIVAPFDGVISSLSGEVGSQVSANTPVFILLNPRLIRIDANVDQADISNLKVGQTATATFDALQGRSYQATITAIGLTPTTQQGVVTYVVTFGVDTSRLPEGTPIPAPGMTASLTVTTDRVENALVVPARSVRRVGRTSMVTVKTEQGDEQRTVVTGTTNGTLTQIVSGLTDGEKVLYSTGTAAPTRTTTGTGTFGGGQFAGPGGFPGGGQQR